MRGGGYLTLNEYNLWNSGYVVVKNLVLNATIKAFCYTIYWIAEKKLHERITLKVRQLSIAHTFSTSKSLRQKSLAIEAEIIYQMLVTFFAKCPSFDRAMFLQFFGLKNRKYYIEEDIKNTRKYHYF